MSNASQQIVNKAWNFAHVLRDDGLSYMAYTWSEENPYGRWRCFHYEDLLKRDKLSLNICWLRDESLEDSDNLPEPDALAQDIDNLEDALVQLRSVASKLK